MNAIRKTQLDADNRRRPRTDRYCVKCHKDIKPSSAARVVHLIDGGMVVLHPEDEAKYRPDNADLGCHLIGSDCAAKIGLEWSTPEVS